MPDEPGVRTTSSSAWSRLSPSGSALVLSHGTGDFDPDAMGQVANVYKSSGTGAQARSKAEFARFFDGLELLPPGIEVPHRWRPDDGGTQRIGVEHEGVSDADVAQWAGIAIKP